MNGQGPVAAVTGAGYGIGWATAQLFSGHCYRVALIDIDVRRAASRAEELGVQHLGIPCDVSQEEDVRRASGEIATRFGDRLDVLVDKPGLGVRIFRPWNRRWRALSKFSASISSERFCSRGRPTR
jgi:NAD(P)-dependent dehydrogenase (short-subunit alcohol dehydrogenase family)